MSDEEPSGALAQGAQPRFDKRFWQRTGVVITTFIAVAGLVVGVVQILQVWSRDTTNFSHLTMAAAPVNDDIVEWAVTADHVMGGLPENVCDDDAWLAQSAIPLHRRYTISMRNSATEGPMLALLDFRSSAPPVEERESIHVRLMCDPRTTLPEQLTYGRLNADRSDEVVQYYIVSTTGPAQSTPLSPAGFNLAPGESGTLQLELFSRNQAEGAIQVSVLSRDERREESIDGSEFRMPALLFAGEMYLVSTPGGLSCHRIERDILSDCTLDDIYSELAIAMEAP
ncbi:hypothetical protein QF046_002956 [Microbacterium sp. W4I4]|uniref:hypothetical protein n=1 Tax=Microbacterium sp. W4I4 TaxID=3042295 RepID=UPI002785002E|nr:hypothetical protein [Microbacterium sp. W4I4]MDQ0615315.1 hypothetical protein [Microbacterium sp. W4I4]